ncbi:MAG: TonB-dependent receptor, partial [Acidimicrobiia bacterium]
MLDQDLAARSASLGRIYRDLGFEQLGRLEAWESVNSDPGDYSGHRLLADTYARLQRHEIARASELLQSQLLQPLNLTPLQPQLAETSLQILEGAGPAEPSFNEFNPLFTRDRWTTQFSAIAGGQRTLSDELTLASLSGRYSFSLGQFHYETDGFRTNNDLEHNIYNAFAQVAVSADTSLQIEMSHRESFTGDLAQNFDPKTVDEVIRNEIFTETARVGIHHRLGVGDDLVASVIYRDIDNDDFSSTTGVDGSTFINNGFSAAGTYSLEVQHQRRHKRFNLITGVGHLDQDRSLTRVIIFNDTVIPVSVPEVDAQHTNAYLYSNFHPLENLITTLGVSYDAFDGEVLDLNRVNP